MISTIEQPVSGYFWPRVKGIQFSVRWYWYILSSCFMRGFYSNLISCTFNLKPIIFKHIYLIHRYYRERLKCSPIARETWVQSQVESYQRLKKTLSVIRYGSRVKWSNPGKGVAPSPTPGCSKLSKREPSGHPRLKGDNFTLLLLSFQVDQLVMARHILTGSRTGASLLDTAKCYISSPLLSGDLIFLWKLQST